MEGLPAKVQLHEKFQDKGLEVITVSVDGEDEMPKALDRLRKLKMTTTNWCLAEAMDEEVMEALEFDSLPALNVYDRDGRLWDQFMGYVDHEKLEGMVEQLLAR